MVTIHTKIMLSGVLLLTGCGGSAAREAKRPADPAAVTAHVGSDVPRPARLPSSARIAAEGVPPLSAVLGRPGTLYLFDQTSGSMPHSADFTGIGSVTALILSLDTDRKALVAREDPDTPPEKAIVLLAPLEMSHRYTMWFVPAEGSAGAGDHKAEEVVPTTAPAGEQH
ncbi:MAG TPA: hypothetical protein VER17_00020 [Tepidisphaeraceae bacterium]|nr:hypothetical protein [Tepidisphaeraceae bacterium]